MGAETFFDAGIGSDMQKVFVEVREESAWENGHGGYTGTIAEKSDVVLRTGAPDFTDPADAVGWAEKDLRDNDDEIGDKWGPAYAIRIVSRKDPNIVLGWLFYGWASS